MEKNFPVENNSHIWSEIRHWFLTVLKRLCIRICQSQHKWKGRKGFQNCSSKLCSSISKPSFNYVQMLHLCESTSLNSWGKGSYLWQGKTGQNSADLCSASENLSGWFCPTEQKRWHCCPQRQHFWYLSCKKRKPNSTGCADDRLGKAKR